MLLIKSHLVVVVAMVRFSQKNVQELRNLHEKCFKLEERIDLRDVNKLFKELLNLTCIMSRSNDILSICSGIYICIQKKLPYIGNVKDKNFLN